MTSLAGLLGHNELITLGKNITEMYALCLQVATNSWFDLVYWLLFAIQCPGVPFTDMV